MSGHRSIGKVALIAASLGILGAACRVPAIPLAGAHPTGTPSTSLPADDLQRAIIQVRVPASTEGTDRSALDRRANSVADATDDLIARLDAAPDGEARIERTYSHLPLVAISADESTLADLRADADVVQVQLDGLSAPSLDESVRQIGGNTLLTAGVTGTGTSIAVIDTGIDSNEPMTNGKVVAQACFASGPSGSGGAGNCPNGTDSQTGTGSGETCAWISLGCWHGTHVASIAAGATRTIAGEPHTGVASGANLLSVNVGSRFTGSASCGAGKTECLLIWDSDVLAALNWVITQAETHNVAAVNLSLGGGTTATHCDSDVRRPAIDTLRAAGVATVIAAGNSGGKNGIASPACISSAISVGATLATSDRVATYSQSAPILDLLAPGSGITAEYPSVPGDPIDRTFTSDGTSMAAPHVAGAFALLRATDPTASVSEIEAALVSTGVPVRDTNGITRPRIDVRLAHGLLASGGGGHTFVEVE